MSSQIIKTKAIHKNNFDRNWSSLNSWPLGKRFPVAVVWSPKLNVEAKNPNGKAPIPNDIWKPPFESPKLKFGKLKSDEDDPVPWCSVRWPGGRGGNCDRGSFFPSDPRPYNGITLSREIAALQTGHVCRVGFVNSHWWRHGQLQIRLKYKI